MRIIGVDPGTLCTGFGIIDYKNNELSYVASGIITPSSTMEIAARLELIYDELAKAIILYHPEYFSIETAFYSKNVQSAFKIGYVRGVALLAASHHNLEIAEYSPREIKKAVVGKGAASKEQVQFMIKKLLSVKKEKMKLDESDALAVSICHALKKTSPVSKGSNWKNFIKNNPHLVID